MDNLQTILNNVRQAPYTRSFRALVVLVEPVKTYTNEKGETRNMLITGVADDSAYAKVIVYDQTKFDRMVERKTILMRNVIVKPVEKTLIVTSTTKVFPTNDIIISNEMLENCKTFIHPPPAPIHETLKEALRSPVKTKVSIKGKVIQEDVTQEVYVKNNKTPVKAIYLKDASTPKCKVTLWRDATNVKLNTGDYITATDVVINTYKNEVSFSTTSLTELKVIDTPEEYSILSIEGASVGEDIVELLVQDGDVIYLSLDKLREVIPDISTEDIEEHLVAKCTPTFDIQCRLCGTEVKEIRFC